MLTVDKLIAQGRGLAPALVKRAPSVALDWDLRQKGRSETTDSAGRRLGIFLARGTVVRGGDVLVADDGSLVRVQAAPQPVLVVRHCTEHGAPSDLLRAAYHHGHRHVAVELKPDHLKLEPDHVLAERLRRMHFIVSEENSPFEPESGTYEAGHGPAHGAHEPAMTTTTRTTTATTTSRATRMSMATCMRTSTTATITITDLANLAPCRGMGSCAAGPA